MIISNWDSECYMGRDSSDSESIYNTTEMHTGPENKKDCPCDSCPLSLQCMQNITECSASVSYTHLTLPTTPYV